MLGAGAFAGSSAPLATFDRAGLAFLHASRSLTLDRAMLALTWLGSLALLLPAAGLVAGFLWRRRRRDAVFIVAALLGSALVSYAAKAWVMRPRPDLYAPLVAMPEHWSYPSTHAMQAAAFALALGLVLRSRRARWSVLLGGAVVGVAVSRVYLQVHHPSDAIVGVLAALFWVTGLRALLGEGKDVGGTA